MIFTYLPTTADLQLVSRRWMNICTTFFPKKYHLTLEDITLSSHSAPVQLLKTSNRVIQSLTLSNVELDFSDGSDFSEVLVFLKRIQSTVTELSLQNSIKPNIDLIRGFQKVQKLEITSPGWYFEIANGKISFPEVRVLRLINFRIGIFGKNMFSSFFRKVSYVEEIEIEGNVVRNYSQFGTFYGKRLKEVYFDIDDEQLAAKSMEFLTIIKGIELRSLTFVITNPYDVDILDRFTSVHPTLRDVRVISKRGLLPCPHPNIKSIDITLQEEIIGVFKALEPNIGLESIAVHFPWKLTHVQINCFFGHDFFQPNPDITTLEISGFNKDCLTCFTNMTSTYPNLRCLELTCASQIELDIVHIIGTNLPHLEELTLIYKDYDNSSKPGFAKYFADWPPMLKLKKVRLEPLSWQWSHEAVTNFCHCCPLLESVHFDGGVDIDDNFLQPIMTTLPFLQFLTIGDTASRSFDIPTLTFLFAEEYEDFSDCHTIEMVTMFRQPCARLRELRLLTCTLDMSLKLRLFQNLKMLRVTQDRKTLLTSKQFHEMRDQFKQNVLGTKDNGSQGRCSKVKRFLPCCFC